MIATTKKKNYRTSFILDLRESKDDSAKVMGELAELLGTLGATVSDSKDLGMRDFARAADRRFAQGHYIEICFDGPGTIPEQLKEKLRLDKRINRIFVELV